jgi:RNA polymerase sigma-70 factor (ECF subfamily)
VEQVLERTGEATATDDVSLVSAARAGNRDAFEILVRRHLDRTFRTSLAILGNESDARDATQEVFITMWRELPRLRELDRFPAWLGRITVNACRKGLRGRRRRVVREIVVEPAHEEAVDAGAGRFVEAAADADTLSRAFDRLAVDARSLLVLHYLDERSIAEISAVLGIPTGTVKSRLSAARGELSRWLEVERR